MPAISVKATPVSNFATVQTYSWAAASAALPGVYDIGSVWIDPPGVQSSASYITQFNNPQGTTVPTAGTTVLPNPIYAPQPGYIVQAWEPRLGYGEFIVLRVPTSTAVPVGTMVQWDEQFALSAAVTGGKTGAAIAVSVATATVSASGVPVYLADGSGIASNSTNVMYAWFQITGRTWALKTAVQVPPASTIYASGTAGRFYVTASTGKGYIGVRAASATTTSTQSTAIVLLNRPNCMTGP
jgi:hypothetical protein